MYRLSLSLRDQSTLQPIDYKLSNRSTDEEKISGCTHHIRLVTIETNTVKKPQENQETLRHLTSRNSNQFEIRFSLLLSLASNLLIPA
ncbi:MAG: hypothetical protein M2R45_04879 [Verrucomicrobia subdivision 3 bacterium]|nr:hypothetical protein [Limisphaerales bacterium]MCS1414373.1 hypothetical protein [Limisphaerales bacterium]